jgi:hypothetical protein
MTAGIQQLFQHVTLWSRVPLGLTTIDPMDAAAMAGSPEGVIENLNRYVREIRLQEIGLVKALNVDPDKIRIHVEKGKAFSDYFVNLSPRPAWMSVHPDLGMTIDDLHQVRMAVVGAKRRLNNWGKRPTYSRPAGLVEHLQWLQDAFHLRSKLARLAVQVGEPDASVGLFYDSQKRKSARIGMMEESLKIYFRVR